MSLNSIKFETTDIARLFKNSLVDIDTDKKYIVETKGPTQEEDTGWKFLGENNKKILIAVRYPDVVFLPDKHLSFLTKLLAACNLNPGDVAIINFQHYSSNDFEKIVNYFKPKIVLLLDIRPSEFGMPMNFPEFQVQAYKDAVYVSSPSLETIEPDKILKGKLWVCLKKIFNL